MREIAGETELATYRQQIEQWRKEREAALRAPDGWLSLAGLHMLYEGNYTLGSAASNHIVLPAATPAHLGTLSFQAGVGRLEVNADTPVQVGGVPMWTVEMVDNRNNRPATTVKIASVSINLHRFGEEIALRVRDSTSAAIRNFAGCIWYEIKPSYRVIGKLVRAASLGVIQVATSVKTLAEYQSVGNIAFEIDGQPLTLLGAATNKPNELMIIFRDATAGHETYGAGRYLYATVNDVAGDNVTRDEAGNVLLDFNKAYSPPCAFTPYATCSLPPPANVLPVAIEAGEKYLLGAYG